MTGKILQSITQANLNAIPQKGINMDANNRYAEMIPTKIFGIIISAHVQYNTHYYFDDVDADSRVVDFQTVAIHEIGHHHLPTLFHNFHDSNPVINAGLNLDGSRGTITTSDEDALDPQYP